MCWIRTKRLSRVVKQPFKGVTTNWVYGFPSQVETPIRVEPAIGFSSFLPQFTNGIGEVRVWFRLVSDELPRCGEYNNCHTQQHRDEREKCVAERDR